MNEARRPRAARLAGTGQSQKVGDGEDAEGVCGARGGGVRSWHGEGWASWEGALGDEVRGNGWGGSPACALGETGHWKVLD